MKKIEIFPAEPQDAWGWQIAANFILVGAGTGFYLFNIFIIVLEDRTIALSRHIPYSLLAPVLAAMGFFALTMKPGRPLRSIYLFRNLRQAWVSRETLLWGVFIPLAIFDWYMPGMILRILTIVAAFSLMISQGAILYQIRAIMGWNLLVMPIFFISSGLASGGGVFLLVKGMTRSPLMSGPMIIAMIAVIANLAMWLLYLCRFRSAVFRKALYKLRRPLNLSVTIGIGHLLPVFLLCSFIGWNYYEPESLFLAEIVCGAAVLVGIIFQKMAIIISASNMKAVVIEASKN
ncbi:MAG: hypothetical protein IT392_01965 [Nitrospirae bacterium]|nr:hypothetical protein [Nitrospirota bacterium]